METWDTSDLNWCHRCRLCFNLVGTTDIFKSNVSENLPYKIKCYLDIVIEPSDTLPNKLCATCILRIQSWHDYKIKCLENDMRFKTKLIELNSVSNQPTVASSLDQKPVPVPSLALQIQDQKEWMSFETELNMPPINIKTEKIDFYTTDNTQLSNDNIGLSQSHDNITQSNLNNVNSTLSATEDEHETKATPYLTTSEKTKEGTNWETVCTLSNSGQNIKMEQDDEDESLNCDDNDSFKDKKETYHLRPRSSFRYFDDDEFEEITPWKCNDCSSYFSSRNLLSAHYNSEDCQPLLLAKYPCATCKKTFNIEKNLARHNLIHMSINLKITENNLSCCSICNLRFADVNRCKEHVRKHVAESNLKHKNENAREFACSLCPDRFDSEDLLYDHRFATHGIVDVRVSCIFCSLKCRNQNDLDQHSKVHLSRSVAKKSTGNVFRCRNCPEHFANKELLEKHEKSNHYQYKCRICQIPCATRSALLVHFNTHTHSTLRNSNPKDDLVNEKENPKCCKYCNIEFKYKSDYDIHYSLHIKAGKSFKCEVTCGSLIRFYCSMCPQLFIREIDGLEHCKFIHKGGDAKVLNLKHPTSRTIENLFLCPICNTELKDDAALKFHIRKIHLDAQKGAKNC